MISMTGIGNSAFGFGATTQHGTLDTVKFLGIVMGPVLCRSRSSGYGDVQFSQAKMTGGDRETIPEEELKECQRVNGIYLTG